MYKKKWDKERLYNLLCNQYEEIIYYCAKKKCLSEDEKKEHFKRVTSIQMQLLRWRKKNFPPDKRMEEYNKVVEEIKQENKEVFERYEMIRNSFRWRYTPNGTLCEYYKKIKEMSKEELEERRKEYHKIWYKEHKRYIPKGIWGKNGKRLSQMTPEEKREYYRIRQQECRRRKKENAKI